MAVKRIKVLYGGLIEGNLNVAIKLHKNTLNRLILFPMWVVIIFLSSSMSAWHLWHHCLSTTFCICLCFCLFHFLSLSISNFPHFYFYHGLSLSLSLPQSLYLCINLFLSRSLSISVSLRLFNTSVFVSFSVFLRVSLSTCYTHSLLSVLVQWPYTFCI